MAVGAGCGDLGYPDIMLVLRWSLGSGQRPAVMAVGPAALPPPEYPPAFVSLNFISGLVGNGISGPLRVAVAGFEPTSSSRRWVCWARLPPGATPGAVTPPGVFLLCLRVEAGERMVCLEAA